MKDPREVFGRVGIVGAGGGFRGAAIPGFLEPLVKRRVFRVEDGYLGATSVAALIEFLVSCAESQEELISFVAEARDIFRRIAKKGPQVIFPFPSSWYVPVRTWNSRSLLSGETLFNLVKNVNPEKSIRSPITFEFTVLDDRTKQRVTLSNKDERFRRDPELLSRAVVASASLCPIFPRVKVGDDFYRDGGSVDLMSAVKHGCDTIFVLFPYPEEYYEPEPEGFFEKHYPLLVDFKACYAAELRAHDLDELAKVEAYNELATHRSVVKSLKGEVAQLQEEVSLLRAAQGTEGWIAKFRNTLARLRSEFIDPKRAHSVECVKPVRVIPLWASPPKTLTLTEFKPEPNDLEIVHEGAAERIERELYKWLK